MNRIRFLSGLGIIALAMAFVLGNPQMADNPNPATIDQVVASMDSLAGIVDANAMVFEKNTAIATLSVGVVNAEKSNIGEAGESVANYPNPFNAVLTAIPSSTWNDGIGTNTGLDDVTSMTSSNSMVATCENSLDATDGIGSNTVSASFAAGDTAGNTIVLLGDYDGATDGIGTA